MNFNSTFSKGDNWLELTYSANGLWKLSSSLLQGSKGFVSLSKAAKEFDHLVTVIKYSWEE